MGWGGALKKRPSTQDAPQTNYISISVGWALGISFLKDLYVSDRENGRSAFQKELK